MLNGRSTEMPMGNQRELALPQGELLNIEMLVVKLLVQPIALAELPNPMGEMVLLLGLLEVAIATKAQRLFLVVSMRLMVQLRGLVVDSGAGGIVIKYITEIPL